MKYLGFAVVMLALVGLNGCSTSPTKLERIEANEAAISALQARPEVVVIEEVGCPAACNEAIDRAFKKSMQK